MNPNTRPAQHSALSTQHSCLGALALAASPTSCAEAFGPGPEGWRCGSCANLSAVHVEGATVYYCCIDGAARRVTSTVCSRFEEAPLAEGIPPPAGVSQSGAPPAPFGRPDEITPEEPER